MADNRRRLRTLELKRRRFEERDVQRFVTAASDSGLRAEACRPSLRDYPGDTETVVP